MKKITLFLSTLCLALLSSHAQSAEKKLDVRHFWQDNGCWCGVAVIEMVEQFYAGSDWAWYAQRQTNLAKPENNGGAKVGNTAAGTGSANPCGPDGGVSTAEMLTVLNFRLKKYGKRFNSATMELSGSPEKSKYFHQRAIESIENGDPMIFGGHTRYKDNTVKHLQHWYLIIGYKDSDGNPNTVNADDGYYIHDAAVGAGFSHLITLKEKGKFVSHFNMVKYIAGVNQALYPVIQVN